jgi:predicted dehydrogenase
VALCDCDERVLERAARRFERSNDRKVDQVTDFRRILDRNDIDAISTATPNHLHSLIGILAAQSGKHVYVEKPVSHGVWEGRQLAHAAERYKRIIQCGTQARSSQAIKDAVEYVRSGKLGKIQYVIGCCYKPRPSIGKSDKPLAIPKHVDYDLWCGPAAKVDLYRPKLHYDWHWDYNTGNGDMGNQGIHQMDIARWFLGVDHLSPRVISVGGRLGYDDDGETPNTQIVYHDYAGTPLIFEVRGLPSKAGDRSMDSFRHPTAGAWMAKDRRSGELKEVRASVACIIHCEGGYVVVPNYNEAIAFDKEGKEVKRFAGADNHYENFIKVVRSRKHTDLKADILEGHLSSALCHTGNVSYLLGRKASSDEIREAIKGNHNASEAYGRFLEHLAANNVNLGATPATLGVPLTMDPRTERFTGNVASSTAKANQLLTREYRKPYVVPETV